MNIDRIASHTSDTNLSRRSFLAAGAAVGGGLVLSLSLPLGRNEAAAPESFAPNAFIRIGSDGEVVLTMPYVEMGQGTYTSIPMLIAEELEVNLKQVRLEHAPPNEKLYVNPLLGVQATGNSNAMRAHGSRCARLVLPRGPCWSRPPPIAGASMQKPAARRTAR